MAEVVERDTKAIRSAYKVFMDGLAGRDFIEHLLTLEMSAQREGADAPTGEQKAFAMVKIGTYYSLRTYLADMSKPAPVAAVRSVPPK